MFTCTLACACACVRLNFFGRISSKIGENIPLRGLHALYVHTIRALCKCVHCTHNIYIYARSHILEQILSKLLRVTESCMGYLICTCALACVRYAHACTHMRACVHSHILLCIRSKFGGDIPLHGLHDFYMRTCVCTLFGHYACTCTAHMCTFTQFWTDSLQNWVTETCTAYLICMCALACARYERGCVRTFFYVLTPTLVKTSLFVGYMHFTCALACAHYARAWTVRIIYIYARSHILGQTLSKLLRVTENCMGYLIFTCTIACARYAHACTYMRVCVHSHIFGCIRSKFGGDIPLHGLHDF
jgi:hypothetical protein